MAKLILSLDGLVLNEFSLTKDRTTIGRKPHNDIQIDNLAVSGEHAVVVTIGNDCFLEDVGSTNGTLVNGAPVKKHLLRNNDVIELGKYKLTFVGRSPVPAAADYEKTMLWRPAVAKQAAVQKAAPTNPPPAPGNPARSVAPVDAGTSSASARASAEGSATRRPIWKIVLVLLAMLILAFLTYGTRG
jgi:pSer/pThr/pTyr-binding forkhead associated (FHA) protein